MTELANFIRINEDNTISGNIATANTAPLRADKQREQDIVGRIPAARWGEPSDLGGAAVFRASPAANYVHGHALAVDGGWLAR